MLLEKALEKFLLALESCGRRPRTIDSYQQRLEGMRRFLDTQGITTIEAVEPDVLDIWIVELRRQEKRWEGHPKKSTVEGSLSEVTIAGRIQSAKAFFNWCVERRYLKTSPAVHLRKPNLDYEVRPNKIMALEDMISMVEAAKEKATTGYPRDLALLMFLIETGCRVGEAASLQLQWLNLEKCEAKVYGKTKWRWTDFAESTLEALRIWLSVRPNVKHDFVFVGQDGSALSERGIYEVLHRLAQKSGVEGRFNPHSIRHLVGQTWSDETNLELVRQKLGHRHISTTSMFYSHQDRPRLKKATRELSLVQGRNVKKP